MSVLESLVFLAASFLASAVGAICGIGGGVIVKPTLELFGWVDAPTISFLSGTMVLAMSCYSVTKSLRAKEKARSTVNSIKLSLDGVTNQFRKTDVFGKGLVYVSCVVFG